MATTKEIQRRIGSVQNIEKVTGAMEQVAAAKMRRAESNVKASRPYARVVWRMLQDVASHVESGQHPLLEERPLRSEAVVAIGANRGLCGAFNSNVIDQVRTTAQQESNAESTEVIVFGRAIGTVLGSRGFTIGASFEKDDLTQEIGQILPLARHVIEAFRTGQYDRITLVYTDYVSALRQEPRTIQLLPVSSRPDEELGEVGTEKEEQIPEETVTPEYTFEPDPAAVLDTLLPRLVELQIYQAVLESDASEHAARMMAMQNAKNAAGDMIDELTLEYNKARQAAITREIAEISAGRLAQ